MIELGIFDFRITTLLKSSIAGVIDDAIFEDEVLAIAEGLGTGEAATNQAEIAGIPAEVLALNLGVVNGNVLGLPEGIFGIEDGIMDLDVAGVLEDVFALQLEIGYLQLASMHERIRPVLYFKVGYLSVSTLPKGLCAIGNF